MGNRTNFDLLLTVLRAEEVASAGNVTRGYELLLTSLQDARESAGEQGIPIYELERRWQEAMDEFAERWAVGRS
jgi:lipopolysaccharide biosynthesis regulator YciM